MKNMWISKRRILFFTREILYRKDTRSQATTSVLLPRMAVCLSAIFSPYQDPETSLSLPCVYASRSKKALAGEKRKLVGGFVVRADSLGKRAGLHGNPVRDWRV